MLLLYITKLHVARVPIKTLFHTILSLCLQLYSKRKHRILRHKTYFQISVLNKQNWNSFFWNKKFEINNYVLLHDYQTRDQTQTEMIFLLSCNSFFIVKFIYWLVMVTQAHWLLIENVQMKSMWFSTKAIMPP